LNYLLEVAPKALILPIQSNRARDVFFRSIGGLEGQGTFVVLSVDSIRAKEKAVGIRLIVRE
jgi:hypothetical protein